jgi:hypothetical protein
VKGFASKFDVIDEGWRSTDMGYFDRPLKVRFKDGMVGEVQIMEQHLAKAKSGPDKGGGGGHDLYVRARSLPEGDPRKRELVSKMQSMYRSAARGAHPSLRIAFRRP